MKTHYKTKFGEHLLNVELNTTMQEVTTKTRKQIGLQLFKVILSVVKNLCKCGHDINHNLLGYIGEYPYRGSV